MTKEVTKEIIAEVLDIRFGFIPRDIKEDIAKLDYILALDQLCKKSLKVWSIEEFEGLLNK